MLPTGSKFTGKEVVNPFSHDFEDKWDLWKMYKQESHRFSYPTIMGEQAGIDMLYELSEGDEDHAVRIIRRSMANNWKDLYKTHNPKKDKKEKKDVEGKKAAGKPTVDDLKAVYIKRNGTEG